MEKKALNKSFAHHYFPEYYHHSVYSTYLSCSLSRTPFTPYYNKIDLLVNLNCNYFNPIIWRNFEWFKRAAPIKLAIIAFKISPGKYAIEIDIALVKGIFIIIPIIKVPIISKPMTPKAKTPQIIPKSWFHWWIYRVPHQS